MIFMFCPETGSHAPGLKTNVSDEFSLAVYRSGSTFFCSGELIFSDSIELWETMEEQ